MTIIVRGHTKSQMQGGRSNHEVLKGDHIAQGRLLAFDAAGKLRDFQCDRMNHQILKHAFRKDAPPGAVCLPAGAIDAVRQFHNA